MAHEVTQEELHIVEDIFTHLLPKAEVYMFGSRARLTARKNSDLDLLIRTPEPLHAETLYLLRDAFSESNIPYFVDIVDARDITPEFLAAITPDFVKIR